MRPRKDLTNKKFGKLKAIEPSDEMSSKKYIRWKCLCDCGNISYVITANLINGAVQSCGKCITRKGSPSTVSSLVGKKFGKLLILELLKERDKWNQKLYFCLCDCGNKIIRAQYNFTRKNKAPLDHCGCETINRIKTNRSTFAGENNPNWKGGVTNSRNKIMQSEKYKEWRLSVFERDNFTCQVCNDKSGNNLEAHHILNFAEHSELIFDISNGITMCKNCHNPNKKNSFHYNYGVKNNTKEQLIKFIKEKNYET